MVAARPVEDLVDLMLKADDPDAPCCTHSVCPFYRFNRSYEDSRAKHGHYGCNWQSDWDDEEPMVHMTQEEKAEAQSLLVEPPHILNIIATMEEFQTDIPLRSGSQDGIFDVLAYIQLLICGSKKHMDCWLQLEKNLRVIHIAVKDAQVRSYCTDWKEQHSIKVFWRQLPGPLQMVRVTAWIGQSCYPDSTYVVDDMDHPDIAQHARQRQLDGLHPTEYVKQVSKELMDMRLLCVDPKAAECIKTMLQQRNQVVCYDAMSIHDTFGYPMFQLQRDAYLRASRKMCQSAVAKLVRSRNIPEGVAHMIADLFYEKHMPRQSVYCSLDWAELEACIENAMKSKFQDREVVLPGMEEDPVRVVRMQHFGEGIPGNKLEKRYRMACKEADTYLRLFLAEKYAHSHVILTLQASPAYSMYMHTSSMFGIRSKDRITLVSLMNTKDLGGRQGGPPCVGVWNVLPNTYRRDSTFWTEEHRWFARLFSRYGNVMTF